ncbi:MAG: maltose ABC transporter permease MalF [Ardenticatenaceae bacterium]|nr:maltose ABC transporter permease MalF [Anaerolineales bacterium]MCB8939078.1 maltose ABC transporter permease MalF [Ardenticatenaceae bacterium]MCB8974834.1 maltose ABC transporter permease MalF [Ardenticatenaceae bacterium]
MSVVPYKSNGKNNSNQTSTASSLIARLLFLFVFDAAAIWFILSTYGNEAYFLAVIVGVVALLFNIVFLKSSLYPVRWLMVGFGFMILFVIYPILFTVSIAFTNFGDGHLFTKEQAISQIERQTYLPEGGAAYRWTAFRTDDNDYALWLIDAAGNAVLARPNLATVPGVAGENGVGELDDNGIPTEIEGYQRLNTLLAAADSNLPNILFGEEGGVTIQVRSPQEAAELQPLYLYDSETDMITNQETGKVYSPILGTFTAVDGEELRPGFRASVGTLNFTRFFTSSALRGPLVRIITWNFAFALFSVLSTFALGLAIALLYNDPGFPFKKLIRSFLLIPYTIPSLITIIIWRGMMNPEVGVINRTLENLINFSPPWFTDPAWAKGAILLVNLWLGYPYFMLITSGALQSIPADIYSAAEVDGASGWQRFWKITLPLLLVSVGPLLVASFTFNFNNFNLIYLFLQGGPPIAGSITRAGHTDILISYVYNLAFAGGRGQDYGLASAITIVIFFIVGAITLFQFRYTKMWEEISENV